MALTIPYHEYTVYHGTQCWFQQAKEAEACRSLDTFCRSGPRVALDFGAVALLFTDYRCTLLLLILLMARASIVRLLGQDSVSNSMIARSLNSSNFIPAVPF